MEQTNITPTVKSLRDLTKLYNKHGWNILNELNPKAGKVFEDAREKELRKNGFRDYSATRVGLKEVCNLLQIKKI